MALGTVSHVLADEAARGKITTSDNDDPVKVIHERFDELALEQHASMVNQWGTSAVPAPRRWPRYFHLRATVGHELAGAVLQRSPNSARVNFWPPESVTPPGNPAPPAPGERRTEISLVDAERGLRGRLDVVSTARDGTIEVIDLKSRIDGDEASIALGRAQLTFYAGLVEAVWGQVPDLFLVAPDGSRIRVPCTAADIAQLRLEIDGYRREAASQSIREMANASAKNCARCPFSVLCPEFRDFLRLEQHEESVPWGINAAWGVVISVTHAASSSSITIRQQDDLSIGPGDVTVTRLARDLAVSPGDSVVVVGGTVQGERSYLHATWSSKVRVGPQAALSAN